MSVLRRLWWALLPYYGWTGGTKEQRRLDERDGAIPPPWYAFPLSWLYHVVNALVRNPFGPRYGSDATRGRPWQ